MEIDWKQKLLDGAVVDPSGLEAMREQEVVFDPSIWVLAIVALILVLFGTAKWRHKQKEKEKDDDDSE